MREALTFDDVLIVPKLSSVGSRKEVSLSTTTNRQRFAYDIGSDFPVISANMDTVTGPEMSKAMLSYGANACLHRFCSVEDSVKMFNESEYEISEGEIARPMVSIGLGKLELERAETLYANCATTFILDVAHGAQQSVVDQVKELRKIIKSNGAIIVGNFASPESVKDFLELESNIQGVKVGIGPGAACTTRIKTGVGYPQLSAIIEISNVIKTYGIPVIADGGMRTPGDIAKAIAAGAHLVMLGGMLSGTDESPGELIKTNNLYSNQDPFVYLEVKKYRGSASKESYDAQGKDTKYRTTEGESFFVPYKGSVKDVLSNIEGGLRSAMTYVGASNLEEFRNKAEFVKITNAGYAESLPHGKK